MDKIMQKLNTMGKVAQQKNTNQVVEVQFPDGGKSYSYIGSGNLRTGQQVPNAPFTHYISGKNCINKRGVRIVATHNIVGANIGDRLGVGGGTVKTIPTGLKYLPGAKEAEQNRQILGQKMTVSDYMKDFQSPLMKKSTPMGKTTGG